MEKIKEEKKTRKSNKGITLIALVITIIVLLILAGVSIAMLTGQNGLLTQADEARTSTNRAGAKEKVQLEVLGSYGTDGNIDLEKLNDNLLNISGIKYGGTALSEDNQIEKLPAQVEVDGYIFEISDVGVVTDKGTPPAGDTVTSGKIVEGSNKTYTDGTDTAVIPVGFAIVPGLNDISEGLVISDKENDTTDEGNQFVWIPVESADYYKATTTYEDTSVSKALTPDEGYLPTFNEGEKLPEGSSEAEKEKNLVTTNMIEKYGVGGFYISRYEAGDGSAKEARTGEADGELVSKKDAYLYNYIKQTDAKEKAKKFKNNEYVKSGLCTGIQWDMVMAFISSKSRLDGENQEYDVTKYSDSRHTESLATSGQNEADKVCNIYDLEGNCYEYVAEKNTYNTFFPYVGRGGSYDLTYSASYRYSNGGSANSDCSFRFVLYIM